MPSKTAPVRGSDKAKTGREASSRKGNNASSSIYARQSKAIPKWNVTEYKPPRKISDKELTEARKMFFEMDRDGSGSIDAEELGMMLRSLGQSHSARALCANPWRSSAPQRAPQPPDEAARAEAEHARSQQQHAPPQN